MAVTRCVCPFFLLIYIPFLPFVRHSFFFFFFNDTATTEIYTLSLHDALPISSDLTKCDSYLNQSLTNVPSILSHILLDRKSGSAGMPRPISYAVFCLKKKN